VFKFKAYFASDSVAFDRQDDARISIDGEGIMPPGLNQALKKMRKGEVAKVKMQEDYSFSKDFKKEHMRFPLPACFNEEEKSENNFKERLVNE